MRPDLEAAIAETDSKSQRKLRSRALKKPLKYAEELSSSIVAVAVGSYPHVSQADGAGMKDAANAATPRLLTLTEESFWVIENQGLMITSGVDGREVKLQRIQDDVRIKTQRRASQFGRKDRLMWFEHHRGAVLETEAFDLGSDDALARFVGPFNAQLETLRAEAAVADEERETARAEAVGRAAAANPTAGAPSRADDLEKLGNLREKGLLTEEEFLAEKRRLLDS